MLACPEGRSRPVLEQPTETFEVEQDQSKQDQLEPVRFLFLVGRDYRHPKAGGGDVQAWSWAKWLVGQGHKVVFICQSHPTLAASEVIDGVEILRLGIGLGLALRAWRFYRRNVGEFDVVYEDPIGSGRTPYFAPLYVKIPVVAVWHQVSADLLKELHSKVVAMALTGAEIVLAKCYDRCHLWAPSNETALDVISELHLEKDRVHIVHPTIPVDLKIKTIPAGKSPSILCVGVIRRYKAYQQVIEALPSVIRAVPDAQLTIAGRKSDDEYASELIALARKLGIASQVQLLFDVTDEEKEDLLAKARVLVLPSKLEGYGIISIEANAAGRPVIASSGVPEAAVTHGVNGLRYEYGNIEELEREIVSVLTNTSLYEELATGSESRASQRTVDATGPEFRAMLRVAMRDGHVLATKLAPTTRARLEHTREAEMRMMSVVGEAKRKVLSMLLTGIVVCVGTLVGVGGTAGAGSLQLPSRIKAVNGVWVRVTPVHVSDKTAQFIVVLASDGADVGKGNGVSLCHGPHKLEELLSQLTACKWHRDPASNYVGSISISVRHPFGDNIDLRFNTGSGRFECRWGADHRWPPGVCFLQWGL